MAYEIIGSVFKIGTTENIQTKSGGTFQRRSITLIQKRFDQNTGQEFEPNYPTIDFTQRGCEELNKYKPGDKVRIRFDISGVRYNDKNTQEERYFNSLRGFRIEPYVHQNVPQYAPQPAPSAPQPVQPSPQQGYQQGGYQQQSYYPQQPPQPQYSPQTGRRDDGLPF